MMTSPAPLRLRSGEGGGGDGWPVGVPGRVAGRVDGVDDARGATRQLRDGARVARVDGDDLDGVGVGRPATAAP